MATGRSCSPKDNKGDGKAETVLSFESMWKQMEPELDAREKHFKDSVKNVVGALVNQEVARIEAKIDTNHERNEGKLGSRTLGNKFESKFDA